MLKFQFGNGNGGRSDVVESKVHSDAINGQKGVNVDTLLRSSEGETQGGNRLTEGGNTDV